MGMAKSTHRARRPWFLAACAAIVSCLATLAGGQAPVNEQPYRVELTVNQPTSRIGEPVTALLKLVGPPGVVSARPRVGKEIGDFEVVSLTASPPFDPGDGMTQSWTMVLTTFSIHSLVG